MRWTVRSESESVQPVMCPGGNLCGSATRVHSMVVPSWRTVAIVAQTSPGRLGDARSSIARSPSRPFILPKTQTHCLLVFISDNFHFCGSFVACVSIVFFYHDGIHRTSGGTKILLISTPPVFPPGPPSSALWPGPLGPIGSHRWVGTGGVGSHPLCLG